MEKGKVQTSQLEATNSLRDYLNTLTVEEYYRKRREIIERCKITDQIFRNWKNGYSTIYELAKPVINEIAGYEVFTIEEN